MFLKTPRPLYHCIWASRWVLGLLLTLTLATTARADAPDKRACLSSFVEGQRARRAGALRDAKRELTTCASDACPADIRSMCSQWTREVDAALPTIVLGAKDAEGRDLINVVVSIDGARVAETLDGKAREVDPGLHTFRFEHASAATTLHAAVREGEKAQLIIGRFAPPLGTSPATPKPRAPTTITRPVPAAAFVFGGLTIAGLAVFTGFGLASRANLATLDREACAPRCDAVDPSSVSGVRRNDIVADIGLGTAAVSLGLATYFFLTRPEVQRP
jgi:hypothetical protein